MLQNLGNIRERKVLNSQVPMSHIRTQALLGYLFFMEKKHKLNIDSPWNVANILLKKNI